MKESACDVALKRKWRRALRVGRGRFREENDHIDHILFTLTDVNLRLKTFISHLCCYYIEIDVIQGM